MFRLQATLTYEGGEQCAVVKTFVNSGKLGRFLRLTRIPLIRATTKGVFPDCMEVRRKRRPGETRTPAVFNYMRITERMNLKLVRSIT